MDGILPNMSIGNDLSLGDTLPSTVGSEKWVVTLNRTLLVSRLQVIEESTCCRSCKGVLRENRVFLRTDISDRIPFSNEGEIVSLRELRVLGSFGRVRRRVKSLTFEIWNRTNPLSTSRVDKEEIPGLF